MVKSCSAYNCTARFKKNDSVSFHGFPKDPKISAEWCKAIRRKNFVPTIHSKLCSKHFKKDCFKEVVYGHRTLKEQAVPSVFNFPPPIGLSKGKSVKPPCVRNQKSIIESSANHETADSDVPISHADTSNIQDSTGPQNDATLNKPVLKGRKKIYAGDFDNLKEEAIPYVFNFPPLIGLNKEKPRKPQFVTNQKSVIESCASSDIFPGSNSANREIANSDVPAHHVGTSNTQDSTGPQQNATLNSPVSEKREIYASDFDNLKEEAISSVFDFLPQIDLSKMKLGNPPCVKDEKSVIESSVSSDIFPDSSSANQDTADSDALIPHVDTSNIQDSSGPQHNATLHITLSEKRKTYAGDFDISDMCSPEEAMKFYDIATTKIAKQQKTINALVRKNRNLNARVTNITSLLNVLWKKNF